MTPFKRDQQFGDDLMEQIKGSIDLYQKGLNEGIKIGRREAFAEMLKLLDDRAKPAKQAGII